MRGVSSVRIRRAVAGDVSRIRSLLRKAFDEYKSSYTPAAYAATTPSEEEIAERVAEGTVWVALSESLIVGTVSAISRGPELYIRSMAVLPAARGRKIGEVLLAHSEEVADGLGCERMTLSTTPFLYRAIRLYENQGFRRAAEGPRELFGTPLFTMTKPVGKLPLAARGFDDEVE
ncbi:MAG: GNAT family N-acetyltransferase [Rubrivivax sp.]|nr:GNAT family N-acetyltransferase [Pyrinomonadaceae bacterium]